MFDDGFEDAKAGRASLDRQHFDSPVDYQLYMDGYNQGRVLPKPEVRVGPYLGGSGVSFNLYSCACSGSIRQYDYLFELGSKDSILIKGW